MSDVEFEIQRQMLERLGIEWTPGEPFVALVADEIQRLRALAIEFARGHACDGEEFDDYVRRVNGQVP